MGAVVRHRAPSMSSIVRTRIRTRDFTPQLVTIYRGKHRETRDVKGLS